MLHCYTDVKAFQEKFAVPMPDVPTLLNDEAYNFRLSFLREEMQEFIDSHVNRDFEGCIDALLDEVYVACGTSLMMGISVDKWNETFKSVVVFDNANQYSLNFPNQKTPDYPQFLSTEQYNDTVSVLKVNLAFFINFHYAQNITKCTEMMCRQVQDCYRIALGMGIDYFVWQEMFADVQRANLSKVRATSVGQSKRKSTLDVIKPPGWIPPDGNRILEFHYPNYKDNL